MPGHDDGTLNTPHPNLSRASLAPAPSAFNLASAMSRCIGAMPQLVVATMLLFGTNFETSSITLATSSAVSTVSLATSITPACTTLPVSRPSSSSGTRELRHSIATCWIELADVDAVGLQRACFLVEQFGKGECHLDAVAIVLVGDGIDDGHRAGQGEFEFACGVGAGGAGLVGMDPARQPQWRHHLRHHRLVAILADSHLDLVGKVDAFDLLQKAVDEMLARLFALGDDVDAGVFLQFQRQQGGVALGAGQFSAGRFPGCPQRVRFGQPFRLRSEEHTSELQSR